MLEGLCTIGFGDVFGIKTHLLHFGSTDRMNQRRAKTRETAAF
jgi:hypothetical protein